MLDVKRSLTIAKEIEAIKRGCWYNAMSAFYIYEDLQSGWYVEGWAIPDKTKLRMNIEHGWLEQPNGTIIDPTWAILGHKNVHYFPGIRYTYAEVVAATSKFVTKKEKIRLPLISRNGTNPFRQPAYFQAYRDSFAAAFDIPAGEIDRIMKVFEEVKDLQRKLG
jgi:hypothetical protein